MQDARALDENWFDRIRSINARLPRRLTATNYKEAKRLFLEDISIPPAFAYAPVFDAECEAHLRSLIELQKDIEDDVHTHPIVRELYLRKIREKETQFTLLRHIHDSHKSEQRSADEHSTLSEQVYGTPSVDIFSHAARKAGESLQNISAAVHELPEYERIQAVLTAVGPTTVPDLTPIPAPNGSVTYITDAEYVRERFIEALAAHGIQNWSVEISTDSIASFKVRSGTRQLFVPNSNALKNRSPDRRLTEAMLSGLVAHEIATHVIRKENGQRSPLKLLSIGLDRYLIGEEGIATYREQQYTGADDYAGLQPYIVIGLAYGLDRNGVRRSFGELFAVLRDYYTVLFLDDHIRAEDRAFLMCTQVYRGVSRTYPGILFTRPCAYREGNIRVHALLARDPKATALFDIGKFDPTNEVHVHKLRTLEII